MRISRRLERLVTLEDVRRRGLRRLPRMVSDFVEGGAEDELTLERNRHAFAEATLRPRVLVDVSRRTMSTVICGQQLSLPVLLAPTGLARLVHPEGELAAARAAHDAGTVLVVSSASSFSIEQLAAEAGQPLWFQLYPWRDRGVTGDLLDRARRAGYHALCVTVDVPAVGGRDRDIRNGFTVPPRVTPRNVLDVLRHPAWTVGLLRGPRITLANLAELGGPSDVVSLARYANEELINPANDWSELAWIRDRWEGPLIVKGVMTADDARRAVAHGVDAVGVSNHGGRQIDGAAASLDALREIADAVEGEVEILVDGGIRRGSDVVKALAIGANACMIGRPFWHGLACAGQAGVRHVLEILASEIDRTLALLGCPDVSALGPEHVDAPAAR